MVAQRFSHLDCRNPFWLQQHRRPHHQERPEVDVQMVVQRGRHSLIMIIKKMMTNLWKSFDHNADINDEELVKSFDHDDHINVEEFVKSIDHDDDDDECQTSRFIVTSHVSLSGLRCALVACGRCLQ